jgi:cytochrome c oxidase cbb3-type subunit 3
MMMFTRGWRSSALALVGICVAMTTHAAAPKESAGAAVDLPQARHDPVMVARGKQLFSVNCGFCHGSDAHGGEGGPNLLRSPIVLNDREGELISAIVLNGRVEQGMPKFDLSMPGIVDIAAYLHSMGGARDAEASLPSDAILVGNAAAGKAYFYGKGHCSQCHSLEGDFAGIGSRFGPKTLQDNIISGAATTTLGAPLPTAPPQSVIVTLPSGEVIRGNLISVDDFNISLTEADGSRRTFPRNGNMPPVEIHNPLQAHLDMLRDWEDRDIHNLTAFLAAQR